MPLSSKYPMGATAHPATGSKAVPRARRASGSKTAAQSQVAADGPQVEIENFGPPAWRSVLNRQADLGYPDFYPARPGFGQTEDSLTEDFVKNGFSAKTFVAVGAESFSMHGPIYGHLMNGCMDLLNKLGQDVAQKRDEGMPQVGERAFRVPVRVTYNDTKRLQFLADLANPAVPLYRLMRNPVPHGFKGVDLFESMFSPPLNARLPSGSTPPTVPEPIPTDRALWFIRVLGANEISAHRGRAQASNPAVAAPSPIPATPSSTNTTNTPAQPISSNDWYTQEFTAMFTLWLRTQLGQLSLPVKAGTVPAAPSKGVTNVLGDEKARAKWIAKWEYSKRLLRELHTRYLVSSRLLASWMVDTLASANLAQLGFVLQLLGDYLPDVGRHVTVARACIRVACARMEEIAVHPAAQTLAKIDGMLQYIIETLFETNDRVLLSPLTWRDHSATIEAVLGRKSSRGRDEDWQRALEHVCKRSQALLFVPTATESTTSPRRLQMEDIQKLDGMNAETNMLDLCRRYFDGTASPMNVNVNMTRLEEKTFVLLNWAMGLFQLGVHRAYAVGSLLGHWNVQHTKTLKKAGQSSNVDMYSVLYKWLDTSEAASREENAFAIGITFGELTRQGLFSFSRYFQTLIAQGHSARSRLPGQPPSRHHHLLTVMPVFVQANDLLLQRRLALCGDDEEAAQAMEAEEERLMEDFKEAVKEYTPEVFGWDRYGRSEEIREMVNYDIPACGALNRYLFLQVRFWLAPAAAGILKAKNGRPAMDGSTFVRILRIFHLCNGYSTTSDLLLKAIKDCEDEEVLDHAIDTIRRAAEVFTANDRWPQLADVMMDRFHAMDREGKHHADLAQALYELAQKGRLSDEDEEFVKAAAKRHRKDSLQINGNWSDAKESMGPLHQAIRSGNVSAATILASRLFTRHGPFVRWASLWWTTVLRGINDSDEGNQSTVDAAVAHLEGVADNMDSGLDHIIATWLGGLAPEAAAETMRQKSAPTLCAVLLNLAAHRKLRAVPQVLSKLVYGIWKHAADLSLTAGGRLDPTFLPAVDAAMVFAQPLLLALPPDPPENLPPVNLRQSLILQTERRKVFNESNVPALIRHLPFLVVLDSSRGATDRLRGQILTLLQGLASTPQFKAAAFRHLDVLKDAFLSNEWSKASVDPSLEAGMVDALKLIMSQGPVSKGLHTIASMDSSSRFSEWRWTSIVLSMRVEFKRLAMRIEADEDADQARQTLNELVHSTLDREISADDSDLLCEAFRGIEAVVAHEIVAVGLERLTALLSQMIGAESQGALETAARSADMMLRVLDGASLAVQPGPLDHAVFSARYNLLELVSVALQAVERNLVVTTEDESLLPADVVPPSPGGLLAAVIKLLKFTLGLRVDEVATMPKPDFARLAGSFLRVVCIIAEKISEDALESLVDMLIYIVDSASLSARNAVHNALASEAVSTLVQQVLSKKPIVQSALPVNSPVRRPIALSNPSTADTIPLDDRPWEMIEYLDPAPRQIPPSERFLAFKPFRDTASVPLSHFSPKVKRDALPDAHEPGFVRGGTEIEIPDDPTYWDDFASERNLGDGLAGEPMAVRQLASALFKGGDEVKGGEAKSEAKEESTTFQSMASALAAATATPPKPRRMSSRKLRALGSNKDPISIDSDDSDDSDTGEVVDTVKAPASKRPRTGSKTTSGKTVGKTVRKTTTGEGARKASTGGKSVRGVGGKVPRVGRR